MLIEADFDPVATTIDRFCMKWLVDVAHEMQDELESLLPGLSVDGGILQYRSLSYVSEASIPPNTPPWHLPGW